MKGSSTKRLPGNYLPFDSTGNIIFHLNKNIL
jgi:hypothetical protein